MVEAAQVRAARALIGWSQAKLAETAGVLVSAINDFETGSPGHFAEEALDKMRATLEAAGVVFLPKDDGGGIGVRLREALEGEYIGWNDLNASNDD
jgi:transcriptional regulator with XRE-family HTH domain